MQEEKYILNVEVDKDNVKIKNKEKIHEREYKATKCVFTFTEDFDNLTKKAIFEAEDVIKEMPIISNECDIPEEVLQDGYLSCNLRVYGYDIEEVEGQTTIRLRYSPTYDTFPIWKGSFIPNAEQGEEITPTQFEQYTNALNQGLEAIEDKIEEADAVLENIDTAIEETNNLNLDVSKEGKVATVTLTKKDATTKVVTLSDGTSLMFNWDGTKLGIKTDEEAEYTYVDLQGIQGETGPMGAPFTIKKTYSSVAEMNADFNNMQLGDYVMIASTVEIEDNAKLYTRGEEQWIFISDFSGSQGIKGETGATPNIQIGSVISGNAPSVTRTGTNENPILNFVLEKGDKGDTGRTGETGATGNGIASIVKTSTSGLVDTYTITFTNGDTTTFEVTNGEDGEVTQEQLDKTNKQVELAKMVYNALPKVTGTGEEITLNNTAETPLTLKLKPSELSQETTTGKNLLNFQDTNNYVTNSSELTALETGIRSTVKIAGQYKVGYYIINDITELKGKSFKITATITPSASNTGSIRMFGRTSGGIDDEISPINGIYNIPSDYQHNKIALLFYGNSNGTGNVGDYVDYTNLMFISSSSAETPYEPYTNGASPNPDYSQDIHVITGDNEIKIENKNLLDVDNFKLIELTSTKSRVGYLFNLKAGTYTISNLDFGNSGYSSFYVNTKYDGETNFIERGNTVNLSTFTMTNDGQLAYTIPLATLPSSLLIKGMLEKNPTATTYVPHKEQVFSIPLGNLEYCKIETYSDEFIYNTTDTNLELNKWYLKKNVKSWIFDNNTSWAAVNSSEEARTQGLFVTYSLQDIKKYGYNDEPDLLSNNYIFEKSFAYLTHGRNPIDKTMATYNGNSLYVQNSDFSNYTNEEVKNAMSGTKIYYPLVTPTYTPLNDTLQQALTNLYNYAYSYQNQTNISQVNDDLASIMDATAIRDISNI